VVDSQLIESRNFQLRDIARAFDVPPYKLAIEGEAEGPAMVQMGQELLTVRSASIVSGGRRRARNSPIWTARTYFSIGTTVTS
jgi:hypothetical protein